MLAGGETGARARLGRRADLFARGGAVENVIGGALCLGGGVYNHLAVSAQPV